MSSCMEPQMSRNHVILVANTAWEWLESRRIFAFGPLPKKRRERDRQERQIEKQAHRNREKYTMELCSWTMGRAGRAGRAAVVSFRAIHPPLAT